MLGRPRWEIKFTHIPTGIEVVRTSDRFRNQHLARESAMRYLRSRLYLIEPKVEDVRFEYLENKPLQSAGTIDSWS